jgi:glutamate-1-semialdehyde 2,1-aminomutase
VPAAVCALTQAFQYNDLASLETLLLEHPGEFAAVIMEPTNFKNPAPGFLEGAKALAHQHGALLIFDEICSGFRFGLGGAQKLFGVTPDLACFGKAMGNGFPISCVVGRADVMAIFTEIFYSFTLAGEVASMAAALKVLDILENTDALARMEANGITLQDAINVMSKKAGLGDRVKCVGRPTWSLIEFFDANGDDSSSISSIMKDLFQQECLKRGILIHTTHNISAAHDNRDIQETMEAYAEIIKTLAEWIEDPNPSRFLEGSPTQPIFRVR